MTTIRKPGSGKKLGPTNPKKGKERLRLYIRIALKTIHHIPIKSNAFKHFMEFS